MRPSLSDRLRSSPTSNIMVEAADHIDALKAEVARLRVEFDRANEALAAIGDYAHNKSTGPAVPDALWKIRAMAYGAVRLPGERSALSGEGK